MPTYAYKCDECGISFERLQRFSDNPLTTCPECGGPIHRVISPVGIIFKGSGFYVTDHRNNSTATLPGSKKNESESAKTSEPATPAATPAPASTPAAAPKPEPPRP